jgi:broad specificity phosphatase PhoE
MSLYFIRHGESDSNVKKYFAGQMNALLTEVGIEQAENEAKRLAGLNETFDIIISSELSRAYNTAIPIALATGYPVESIVMTDLLNERGGGAFEGKPLQEFFALSENEQIEGGAESFKHLGKRATELLELVDQNYPNKKVLLVSHATFGEMLQTILTHNDYTKILDGEKIPNATMIRMK